MNEKVFKTKTGQCHILDDRIVLTREGFVGNISDVIAGKTISQMLIIYILFLGYMLYQSYNLYQEGSTVRMIMRLVIAALLLTLILKSINNSATPVVFRDKIRDVVFKDASKLTRSYFVVTFENDKGKLKKRLIMLPGSLSGGKDETDKALAIMRQEGLIKG
jgi:hypothetical protein